jgi:23S rRNA (adenine2503-C2)-methyltransferase
VEILRTHILDLTYYQLKEWLISHQEPVFQTDLITNWVYRKMAYDFDQMVDLRTGLKEKLKESASLTSLKTIDKTISSDGQTRKFLFETVDGRTIETALMNFLKNGASRERRTVCVSSQVGCDIGCKFCATGQQGFERNLRTGEIIEQVLSCMRLLRDLPANENAKVFWPLITHVVFMGMGEPLANYENVIQAIRILNSPKGLNLGVRQITLSTSGLVPQIRRLYEEKLQFELAISLHAANNELRNRLVPVNHKYPLEMLIDSCKGYYEKTGRKPLFEYALFGGVNDSISDAENLVNLLADFKCSVNLIIGNQTSSNEYQPATLKKALEFQQRLMAGGLRALIRNSKGADIEAGCGQLKSRWLGKEIQDAGRTIS